MTRSDEHKPVQDEDDPQVKLAKETIEDLTPKDDQAEDVVGQSYWAACPNTTDQRCY